MEHSCTIIGDTTFWSYLYRKMFIHGSELKSCKFTSIEYSHGSDHEDVITITRQLEMNFEVPSGLSWIVGKPSQVYNDQIIIYPSKQTAISTAQSPEALNKWFQVTEEQKIYEVDQSSSRKQVVSQINLKYQSSIPKFFSDYMFNQYLKVRRKILTSDLTSSSTFKSQEDFEVELKTRLRT